MNIVNISTLDPAAFLLALGATLLAFVTACTGTNAGAADLYSFTATPLKAPDCVLDPSSSFFAQNTPQVNAPHPTLPIDRFYLIVRYLGDDAVTYAPSFDFARIPESYGYVPFRGLAVTDLSVPDAKSTWQRARRPDADLDNSSAFQMHCFEAASFINSWMFPYKVLTGGGPHAIYGYSFNHPSPPAIFDGDSNTDLVLQASVEIPFVVTWPDPTDASRSEPIGQVVVFAYFRDRGTGKTFALLLGVFDNRFSATPEYAPFVAHDGDTPFVSAPLSAGAVYATLSTFWRRSQGNPGRACDFSVPTSRKTTFTARWRTSTTIAVFTHRHIPVS